MQCVTEQQNASIVYCMESKDVVTQDVGLWSISNDRTSYLRGLQLVVWPQIILLQDVLYEKRLIGK